MSDYISRDELIKALETDYNSDWSGVEEYVDGARDEYDDVLKIVCGMKAADVQPTEKVEEYRSLLEECERKLSYLFECEIESTWESQKVKELIAKIQSCIQNNYGGG